MQNILHNTILIRIRTEAISLFSFSSYMHGMKHDVADKLCLAMLKQNTYIILYVIYYCI